MKRCVRRGIACLAAALTALSASAGEPQPIGWDSLPDPARQQFVDPFRDLEPMHLADVITIVRLRERLARSDVTPGARPRIEARLDMKEAALAEAGIDLQALLAERWAVADRRQAAARAGNPALAGNDVALKGYLIPAGPTEDGAATAYLVPQFGMCAHVPPPPPNQLVRLVLAADAAPWEDAPIFAPVNVQGVLRLEETERQMLIVDGPVRMWSAWTLETETIERAGGDTAAR